MWDNFLSVFVTRNFICKNRILFRRALKDYINSNFIVNYYFVGKAWTSKYFNSVEQTIKLFNGPTLYHLADRVPWEQYGCYFPASLVDVLLSSLYGFIINQTHMSSEITYEVEHDA
jgi:hypothetical protein